MASYVIQINEYQRLLLLQMLPLLPASEINKLEDEPGDAHKNAAEEIVCIVEMLEKLPADEAESPGCVHGFCL